jgi:hypothetical protein
VAVNACGSMTLVVVSLTQVIYLWP